MIADVPVFVLFLVERYLDALLGWFSGQIYAVLLERERDHELVRLHQQVDWVALEQPCAAYYKESGLGTARTHSVPRLCRILLLKYLYAESARACEERLRYHWLVRWFAGYTLTESVPDHSTIHRFERWVATHQPRLFFDALLQQIDATCPAQHQQPQVADTFAMHADATSEPLIERIRHCSERLLLAVEALDGRLLARVQREVALAQLFGTGQRRAQVDEATYQQRLDQTVRATVACLQSVRTHLPTYRLAVDRVAPVAQWLGYLDKVLADELALIFDEQGTLLELKRLPKAQRGSYRLMSATDPEATFRVHGDDEVFGYNISVATTRDFIREIRADTGSQPDAVALPDLLAAQHAAHDFFPPKLIYDQAAGSGKTFALVHETTHGQTQLVAPPIDYEQRQTRFGPSDFTLSADEQTLTCPNGQLSQQKYRSGHAPGVLFRFKAAQCADCPLWDKCRDPDSPPSALRQVFISDFRLPLLRAQGYAQTLLFKQDMRQRFRVEQTIALLVRDYGARRARVRGLAKVDFQVKMAATAFNLRRWLKLLQPRAPDPLAVVHA